MNSNGNTNTEKISKEDNEKYNEEEDDLVAEFGAEEFEDDYGDDSE